MNIVITMEEKEISDVKLFDKYPYDVEVADESMREYINLKEMVIPNTFGRIGNRKKHVSKNIIERLVNKLMRGGTGGKVGGKLIRTHGGIQGKKQRSMKIVMEAFEIIANKTKENPIKILVDAIENSAPREDTTRVEYGGAKYQVSVDIAPKRRVDMALKNITMATIMSSFNKKATMAEALANEMVLASRNDINSYAIKRRDEVERIARSAR